MVLLLLGVGTATAGPSEDGGTPPRLRVEGGGPLHFDDLAPGVPVSRTITLDGVDAPARFRLATSDLVSFEGGCIEAELRAGDTTCGSDEGELLPWLRVRIERLGGTGPTVLAERAFATLAETPVDLGVVRPDGRARLRVTVWPDASAGSDTMTDAVDFTVAVSGRGLTAELPGGGTAGDGSGNGSGGSGGSGNGSGVAGLHGSRPGTALLPGTGNLLDPLHVALGLGLVVVGGALVRRRPDRGRAQRPRLRGWSRA